MNVIYYPACNHYFSAAHLSEPEAAAEITHAANGRKCPHCRALEGSGTYNGI